MSVESAAAQQEEAPRVLVVDDEKVIREILSDFLTMEGYVVRTVEDGSAALRELLRRPYDLCISDLKMPVMDGLELLEKIAEENINVLTVIMTGFGTVETAIEAMRKGAYDYILKPFKVEQVVHTVQRGLERQRLQAENLRLKEALSLFRLSEAMATSLSLETILDLVMDSTLDGADADVATLFLRDPRTGKLEERVRKASPKTEVRPHEAPNVLFDELLPLAAEDKPILAHGLRAHRYFDAPPEKGLVSFCGVPLKVRQELVGMLCAYTYRRGNKFSEGQRRMLSILGSRAAVSIENARLYEALVRANADLTDANLSLEENFKQTIAGFACAIEESDRYTRGHSERVSFYAKLIAEGLDMPKGDVDKVVQAGLMHDIGKIGIRYEKLNKPGKLTAEEMVMIRQHPIKGKRILEPIPFMRELIPAAWCHHEAFDGSGYPRAIGGDEIPLFGRIVAVADTYDAMTSDRAYRKALPHDVAIEEIERCVGSQLDPMLVSIFVRKIEEYRSEAQAQGIEVPR
jgi:response regulator RpfG family c-di-GMP phosphodiesterase